MEFDFNTMGRESHWMLQQTLIHYGCTTSVGLKNASIYRVLCDQQTWYGTSAFSDELQETLKLGDILLAQNALGEGRYVQNAIAGKLSTNQET